MNLDFYQQQAAYQNTDYSIIIAGAGTGKTYTLFGRIQYLMEQQHLRPEEILVISYTNETVREFQEKAQKSLNVSIPVFTFHKLAINILKDLGCVYQLCTDSELDYAIHEFLFTYCSQNKYLRKYVIDSIFVFGSLRLKSFPSIVDNGSLKRLQKDLEHFVHLWKAKGYDTEKLLNYSSHTHFTTKNFFLLSYFFLQFYVCEKESQSLLDFDDLIEFASKKINELTFFPYRHILVDEFQDSSIVRIHFFQKLVETFSLSFTVVGDDCQSIYRFSGTESNCFSLLKQCFPSLSYFYLKYTYRNCQELIDIANHFILKNPNQMRKEIVSNNHLNNPIEILYYHNPKIITAMLHYILNQVSKQSILFLGRNSFDWKYYFSSDEMRWINHRDFTLKSFPDITFTFLTVHQSKGLEANTVILLHMENSTYGFPNQIKNTKAIQLIMSQDKILYEEERRLFYVALTRTRGKCFLLVPLFKPSVFINELTKDFYDKLTIKYF